MGRSLKVAGARPPVQRGPPLPPWLRQERRTPSPVTLERAPGRLFPVFPQLFPGQVAGLKREVDVDLRALVEVVCVGVLALDRVVARTAECRAAGRPVTDRRYAGADHRRGVCDP